MSLLIVRPGLLTTVQDLGRFGSQDVGVSVSGSMDWFSHRLANCLVGNDETAATLEVTLIGPEIAFEADATIAITGAHFEITCGGQPIPTGSSVRVAGGQAIRFGRLLRGARAYIAVAGGIQTPVVLGSRATHLVTGLGGVEGRAVAPGDRLPIGSMAVEWPVRTASGLPLPNNRFARLRVMRGPQDDWFAEAAFKTLFNAEFLVSSRSNRMGFRLEGPGLARSRAGEPISEPVAMGAIQVPGSGEPIMLMADRQTAGGYPKIGHVITADLPLAGQLAPGDRVGFVECNRKDAMAALLNLERQLLRWPAGPAQA
jgi:antagonist of KipI